MDAKFILIRHGESMANATFRYAGHSDYELSPKGRMQAEAAAEYFKDEKLSAIYSSDLKRAYSTAIPHSERHSLPIIKSKELREVYVGEWENQTVSDITERWHNEFCVEWKQKFGSSTPPEGESVYLAGKRMHDKLMSIAKEIDGKILVTAHAAVIRAFWCYFQGIEPQLWGEFVPFPTNASASFVGFDGEKFIPIRYSFDDYISQNSSLLREA